MAIEGLFEEILIRNWTKNLPSAVILPPIYRMAFSTKRSTKIGALYFGAWEIVQFMELKISCIIALSS